MKLKFESDLEYQNKAISSTVNLLNGQKIKDDSLFSVPGNQIINEGIGNNIDITNSEILVNLKEIQLNNELKQSDKLSSLTFDIEMETGTGKTYVYLKTILEMNKKYGFKKFMIIVPSIAIKEGVYKTLQITKDHFKNIYNNVQYEFYIYKSKDINQIHSFSTSNNISIMIINIDSFNKKEINKIHQNSEDLHGSKPIDLLRETNPILIIDEPQSLSTDKASESIKELNPSLILRYSATHKKIDNLIYKLDPIDAFNQKLVKKIEVLSIIEKVKQLKLISTKSDQNGINARIEIEIQTTNGVRNKEFTISKGNDLYELSNKLEKYDGFIVEEINTREGDEFISFALNSFVLTKNSHIGGDEFQDELKRLQIQSTIEEHFKKQLKLKKHNVKVLSLFFIDKVHNYREYEDGTFSLGKYAKIFEEEFIRIGNKIPYNKLFENKNIELLAKNVHNGYFSKDKKGIMRDTKGNTKDDNSTYELIMKEKEKLLSFNEDLSFIFSHSALREGWDNPNVFQICTLNESKSVMKKRQEIGRGLRLCVNQEGERQYEEKLNVLTIIANESYESFAKELQKDYQDEGIRFNLIEPHSFANIINPVTKERVGSDLSLKIFNKLSNENYLDSNGYITNLFSEDENLTRINLDDAEVFKAHIINLLSKISTKLPIQNANNKLKVKINKEVFLNEDFKIFWNKIKYKTTYAIDFDVNEFKSEIIDEINQLVFLTSNNILKTKAELEISNKGVLSKETKRESIKTNYFQTNYPDIVSKLQENTNLTRKTIVEILKNVNNFDNFKLNPQNYIDRISNIIKVGMKKQMIDGIKYTKIGNDYYYEQSLFEDNELSGYFEKNIIKSQKNIYDYVLYDSGVERTWAQSLENNKDIILYAKLPYWFKIPTPLGSYNPDWAILVKKEGEKQKLYFVIETKGSVVEDSLRLTEQQKIKCGEQHFKAIGEDVEFEKYDKFENFIETIK